MMKYCFENQKKILGIADIEQFLLQDRVVQYINGNKNIFYNNYKIYFLYINRIINYEMLQHSQPFLFFGSITVFSTVFLDLINSKGEASHRLSPYAATTSCVFPPKLISTTLPCSLNRIIFTDTTSTSFPDLFTRTLAE